MHLPNRYRRRGLVCERKSVIKTTNRHGVRGYLPPSRIFFFRSLCRACRIKRYNGSESLSVFDSVGECINTEAMASHVSLPSSILSQLHGAIAVKVSISLFSNTLRLNWNTVHELCVERPCLLCRLEVNKRMHRIVVAYSLLVRNQAFDIVHISI